MSVCLCVTVIYMAIHYDYKKQKDANNVCVFVSLNLTSVQQKKITTQKDVCKKLCACVCGQKGNEEKIKEKQKQKQKANYNKLKILSKQKS